MRFTRGLVRRGEWGTFSCAAGSKRQRHPPDVNESPANLFIEGLSRGLSKARACLEKILTWLPAERELRAHQASPPAPGEAEAMSALAFGTTWRNITDTTGPKLASIPTPTPAVRLCPRKLTHRKLAAGASMKTEWTKAQNGDQLGAQDKLTRNSQPLLATPSMAVDGLCGPLCGSHVCHQQPDMQ